MKRALKRKTDKVLQTPIEKTIASKRKLITRLYGEIEDEKRDSIERIDKIRFRIGLAQALLSALEKGTQ